MKTLKISPSSANFYKSLFILVGPIAIQNFITAAVSSADVIMLGYVGQTELAAASLAGQVQFILFLFFTGLSSGLAMLVSQYWGKNEIEPIKSLAGYGLKISVPIGTIFTITAYVKPDFLMSIFTNDPNLIESGVIYLRYVAISYFFLSISQVYQAIMRSTERVKIVTAMTFITLGLNVILNAIFIFGLLGFPKMGIMGVALATSISRVLEFFLCIGDSIVQHKKHKPISLSFSVILKKNKLLLRDFFYYSSPALGNEFVWGAAFAMYSVILGRMGSDIVAANSVITVIRNLASVLYFGMAYGGAVLVGKRMGSGNLQEAKKDASRLCKITIGAGVVGGILIFIFRPIVFQITTLTVQALADLNIMLYINSLYIIGASVNTVIICGIFRSGGDAKFGFIVDTIIMWGVSVPLGLIAAFVLKLPPIAVYAVLCLDELEKMPFVIAHYKNGKWAKNITRDFK